MRVCYFVSLFSITLFWSLLKLNAQDRLNVDSVSNLSFTADLNDIWGHVDSLGNEYALVGRVNGFSVVSLANPSNPVEVYSDTSVNSLWRDVKTWKGYAYVVNETNGGMEIYDLNNLPNSVSKVGNYRGSTYPFQTAHNLFIDSNGVAYLFGLSGDRNVFLDVDSDPENPIELGVFDSLYLHDGVVRNDTLYGGAVFNGVLVVIDVTNKSNPTIIGTKSTPSNFTHNVWLSDNGQYAFTTDEKPGAFVAAYNVSDPTNIFETDRIRSRGFTNVIPHNTHVLNDFLITSYYTAGVSIIDGSNPDDLIEVGYFDSSPNTGSGFSGNWGAYPYLPSGLLIISDMQQGLFVLNPAYKRASYLKTIVAACNGRFIDNVKVSIIGEESAVTNLIGEAELGGVYEGYYQVRFEANGFYSKIVDSVLISPGLTKTLFIELLDSNSGYNIVVEDELSNTINGVKVELKNSDTTILSTTDSNGNILFPNLPFGEYQINIGKWGYKQDCLFKNTFNCRNLSRQLIIKDSLEDYFNLDLGWKVSGNEQAGAWTRATPIGTVDRFFASNPAEDIAKDCGDKAFVTGNGFGAAEALDVDDTTILTSPEIDLGGYIEPYLNFYTWFYNGGESPDDYLLVSLVDSSQTEMVLDTIDQSISGAGWILRTYKLRDIDSLLNRFKVQFTVIDQGDPHILEAGIDKFFISEGEFIGLEETAKSTEAVIYPNPFRDEIVFIFEKQALRLIELYDAQMRLVAKLRSNKKRIELKVPPTLVEGFYFARVFDQEKGFSTYKLVKH